MVATRAGLRIADIVVTEDGFGADLGAEKFLDIKCRKAGLAPDAVVIVATVRALKMHGGVAKDQLGKEDLAALKKGFANLERHLQNVERYVAIAREDGGKVVVGGRRREATGGFFYEPTVITDLPNESRAVQEEIFGPVVTVQAFDTDDLSLEEGVRFMWLAAVVASDLWDERAWDRLTSRHLQIVRSAG